MIATASVPSASTDLSALKFNQYAVIGVTVLALMSGLSALTLILGAAMLLGAIRPELSPLRAAYRMSGRRLGLRPEVVAEDPRAHHFAQGVGGVFLLASGLSGLAGLPLLGLGLGLAVIALAGLNLSQKICVGCLLYFQYRRLRYAVLSR
ncbi:DUF4395 domain-containing protein [Deinococcus radiopugnans]|uniref:DUF4395 domain-containing protein n=1 Tax=Deinococcus radiopugnans ATCC 19172 TaxID=585398 RepID=A0A5C4YBY9_9DEIO|nr:DUF4395 domain-containing protein [Deinococcus radiopugnans]MBB6015613.1 hypothetical protein [Deinococcus radiopugnans ATCC 19172]TNM72683.1 DUF4395 domain-containing protein [Deinococcus radiopugnans ATCC 19172]